MYVPKIAFGKVWKTNRNVASILTYSFPPEKLNDFWFYYVLCTSFLYLLITHQFLNNRLKLMNDNILKNGMHLVPNHVWVIEYWTKVNINFFLMIMIVSYYFQYLYLNFFFNFLITYIWFGTYCLFFITLSTLKMTFACQISSSINF